MKKLSKLMTVVCAAVFAFGAANNIASADTTGIKYAVVDVQKVVASSKQVNALKAEQKKKMQDLSTFVQSANKQLQAETNADKKKALEEKLAKELGTKKAAVEKEYVSKLESIDLSISKAIEQQAKAKGFDLVLTKAVVLYSNGTDITDDVIKVVK